MQLSAKHNYTFSKTYATKPVTLYNTAEIQNNRLLHFTQSQRKKQQKEKKIKKKVKYQLIIPDILNLKETLFPTKSIWNFQRNKKNL